MLFANSKPENYCMSGPVKFENKSKIDNFIRNHTITFESNTHHVDEVFCLIRSFFDA